MKIIFSLILLSLLLINCNNNKEKQTEIFSPYIFVDVKNGDGTKDTIDFLIDNTLTDSLKINKNKLQLICNEASIYGDWNVKYKPTFKYKDNGFIFYDKELDEIGIEIRGTCENAYGVPDDITNVVYFNKKGIMVVDKDELPKITTF